MLSAALLQHGQVSVLSAREEQNPLTERQSDVFFFSPSFFTFPVGVCGLWVSEAAVFCVEQQQTAFPWDKEQTPTIWFWLRFPNDS